MDWKITVLIIAAASLILAAFMGRYELVSTHTDLPRIHRLDRWTGDVLFINLYESYRVEPKQKSP